MRHSSSKWWRVRIPHDATAAPEPVPRYRDALTGDVAGLRIGVVPRRVIGEGVDPVVSAAVDAALDVLKSRGAKLVDIELPHARFAIPIDYLIAMAEASVEPRAIRRRALRSPRAARQGLTRCAPCTTARATPGSEPK